MSSSALETTSNRFKMRSHMMITWGWESKENEVETVFRIFTPAENAKKKGGLVSLTYLGVSDNNEMISGGWQNMASYMFEKKQWVYGEKDEHHNITKNYYVDIRFVQIEKGDLHVEFTTNFIGSMSAHIAYLYISK